MDFSPDEGIEPSTTRLLHSKKILIKVWRSTSELTGLKVVMLIPVFFYYRKKIGCCKELFFRSYRDSNPGFQIQSLE